MASGRQQDCLPQWLQNENLYHPRSSPYAIWRNFIDVEPLVFSTSPQRSR